MFSFLSATSPGRSNKTPEQVTDTPDLAPRFDGLKINLSDSFENWIKWKQLFIPIHISEHRETEYGSKHCKHNTVYKK